jgi:hypothetical protein
MAVGVGDEFAVVFDVSPDDCIARFSQSPNGREAVVLPCRVGKACFRLVFISHEKS